MHTDELPPAYSGPGGGGEGEVGGVAYASWGGTQEQRGGYAAAPAAAAQAPVAVAPGMVFPGGLASAPGGFAAAPGGGVAAATPEQMMQLQQMAAQMGMQLQPQQPGYGAQMQSAAGFQSAAVQQPYAGAQKMPLGVLFQKQQMGAQVFAKQPIRHVPNARPMVLTRRTTQQQQDCGIVAQKWTIGCMLALASIFSIISVSVDNLVEYDYSEICGWMECRDDGYSYSGDDFAEFTYEDACDDYGSKYCKVQKKGQVWLAFSILALLTSVAATATQHRVKAPTELMSVLFGIIAMVVWYDEDNNVVYEDEEMGASGALLIVAICLWAITLMLRYSFRQCNSGANNVTTNP